MVLKILEKSMLSRKSCPKEFISMELLSFKNPQCNETVCRQASPISREYPFKGNTYKKIVHR
jgi:hypothetical protein